MNKVPDMKPLSEALSEPLVKAYKVGGYGLVFVFAGTMLLLVALFFGEGILRYFVGMLGALMILAVLGLFYFQDIKKLVDVNRNIQKNQELINTVQETAIQMTDLAYTLQALAFKNADELATALTQVRSSAKDITAIPLLSNIPGVEQISKIADNCYVVKAEDLSKSIVSTTATAKTVIEDVKTALVQSDPTQLKKYLDRLKRMDLEAKRLLEK
jgi:type II secretory pathway component PulJ